MDQKCAICHENIPVIYTSRYENGKMVNEGICLSCAVKNKVGGMEQMFSQSGINEDNVDEIQDQLNEVLESMRESGAQENLLAQMFGGNVPENIQDIIDMQSGEADVDPADTQTAGLTERSGTAEKKEEEEEKKNDGVKWPFLLPRKKENKEEEDDDSSRGGRRRGRRANKRKYLDQFGTNLNTRSKEGKIDPLIGREKELNRVVEILNRRTKNNPVLLGEPGVGKTAIAEGLATKIVEGDVPPKLLDMELYALDMTAIVAGTQFRGQFESRMKGIVDEATSEGNIVLVIDELHNIMGAGDADGAMNAANILKPALAKGDIRVLGSTTLEEYRRYIEKDSALERRFQKVIVDPPTEQQAYEILQGLRDKYEEHHHIVLSDETLLAAVQLSERYMPERFLPDKSIDVIDEAGSKANLKDEDLIIQGNLQREIGDLERELQDHNEKMPEDPDSDEAEKFYAQQAELKSSKLKAEEELAEVELRLEPTVIAVENIAEIVSDLTGIPVTSISLNEREKLLSLESLLHERIVGQQDAVSAVSRATRRSRAGLRSQRKPSSFMFVGPTGVGKTELVKSIAHVMFDSEDSLIRLDMSEFMEAHTVSKLIGSPPGYVGYDDGGQLTEKVRRKPYSAVLFDEIEKAHTDVFNILLQILDEGRLTDAQGRTVDFSNTIIIMTSNVGTTKKAGYGFGAHEDDAEADRIRAALRETFRPEFLNRIDEVVVFHRLTRENIREIVDMQLEDVNTTLKASASCEIRVSDEAKDALANEGYSQEYGARELQRTVTRRVEDKLAEMKLLNQLDGVSVVAVDYKDGEYVFEAK